MARRFPRVPCNPIDTWSWLEAPDEFVRFLRTSPSRIMEEEELVSQGRHEWVLCAPSKTLKLGGNNRVQVLDVLRGRCLFDADGDATESAKKARTCLCICRVIVHDSGAFKIHDISPMEGYDVGFCPLLPALIRHRLDIAYTRYWDEFRMKGRLPSLLALRSLLLTFIILLLLTLGRLTMIPLLVKTL